ncbi:MAG: hypothetical protein ACYSRR_07905, partial [Planctomycetota bacterium]
KRIVYIKRAFKTHVVFSDSCFYQPSIIAVTFPFLIFFKLSTAKSCQASLPTVVMLAQKGDCL